MKRIAQPVRQREPWLDENGRPLNLESLRFFSKHWDQETWERYLETLEAKPESLALCPLSVPFSTAPKEFLKLHAHLHELSPREKLILHLRFWESLTIEEIGDRLDLSWEEVDEAITQIQDHLKSRLTISDPLSLSHAA